MTLMRALASLGNYEAVQGLRRLYERESDPDLKRRLRSAVEEASDGERGGRR